jgi:nicotinate-nucleotide--dimethylbenzimidazole phosphoribosyltransferase
MSSSTSSADITPLADIRALLADLPVADENAMSLTAAREAQLIKPPGALGRLEDISSWLSAWTGKSPPQVTRPIVAVFASDAPYD